MTSQFRYEWLDCGIGVICLMIGIIGTISNSMLTVHLTRLKDRFRTRTTSMLLQLSVADFLTCAFVAPAVAAGLFCSRSLPEVVGGRFKNGTATPITGTFISDFIGWTSTTMNEASLLLVCVFSIDRYISVSFPLQRMHMLTNLRFSILCLFAWLYPGLTCLYPFFKNGGYLYVPLVGFFASHLPETATPEERSREELEEKIVMTVATLTNLIPFLATLFLCGAVFVRLAQPGAAVPAHEGGSSGRKKSGSGRRMEAVQMGGRGEILSSTSAVPATGSSTVSGLGRKSERGGGGRLFSRGLLRVSSMWKGGRESSYSHETVEPMKMRPTIKRVSSVFSNFRGSRHFRSTSLVVMIVMCYLCCLLPANLLSVYHLLITLKLLPDQLRIIYMSLSSFIGYLYCCLGFSICLVVLNSCCNPFIYYFRSHPIFPDCGNVFLFFRNKQFGRNSRRSET